MNARDSVGELPGVGPKIKSVLNQHGIFTIEQLKAYRGYVDGIPFEKIKQSALQHKLVEEKLPTTSAFEWRTKNHSWYGCGVHIIFENRTYRARVQEFVLDSTGAFLSVMYKYHKSAHYRKVSPLYLAALFVLWNRTDIVSDDEIDEDTDNEKHSVVLPFFQLHETIVNLTLDQKIQLDISTSEVQHFQAHSKLLLFAQ